MAQHSSSITVDQTWKDLVSGNQRFMLGKTVQRDLIAERKALPKPKARESRC